MTAPIRYGLIGCGGFGRFCLEQYRTLPAIECRAVADLNFELAQTTAAQFGLDACKSPEALVERADIDLVHLATPPFTHARLALAAMRAGKHVLCEKPLALSLEDAQAMTAMSREKGVVLAVNLMMRYSPLCQAVKALVDGGALGAPIHAHFVNDAKDEPLPPSHWFWDPVRSGGIFIEHGVHFFDLFEWWFGPGKVLAAQEAARPGTEYIEQVNCTVKYRDSILVNFYHGFHQATRRDHQEWMIVFECGTLTMREWVPTSLQLDFLATDAAANFILELFVEADLRIEERFTGAARHFTSRHQEHEADGHFVLTVPALMAKPELYGHMLRALMMDQVAAIHDSSHARLVTEANGWTSLVAAVQAQHLASGMSPPELRQRDSPLLHS